MGLFTGVQIVTCYIYEKHAATQLGRVIIWKTEEDDENSRRFRQKWRNIEGSGGYFKILTRHRRNEQRWELCWMTRGMHHSCETKRRLHCVFLVTTATAKLRVWRRCHRWCSYRFRVCWDLQLEHSNLCSAELHLNTIWHKTFHLTVRAYFETPKQNTSGCSKKSIGSDANKYIDTTFNMV